MTEQSIGRYRVIEEIASGGQGVVYRAFAPETSQIVAVKILLGNYDEEPNLLERFRREARLTSSLDHLNVVKIFEVSDS